MSGVNTFSSHPRIRGLRRKGFALGTGPIKRIRRIKMENASESSICADYKDYRFAQI